MGLSLRQLGTLLKQLGGNSGGAAAIRGGMGVVGGGLMGYYGTPEAFGYSDVPEARRMSTLLDALAGGAAAAGGPALLSKIKRSPTSILPLSTGIGVAEIIPVIQAERKRSLDMAKSKLENAVGMNRLQEAAISRLSNPAPTALQQAQTALASPTMRGAATGAAGASLLALLTGMTRKKTTDEVEEGKGRLSMVGSDLLKYLIPGVVGGGVIGSLQR